MSNAKRKEIDPDKDPEGALDAAYDSMGMGRRSMPGYLEDAPGHLAEYWWEQQPAADLIARWHRHVCGKRLAKRTADRYAVLLREYADWLDGERPLVPRPAKLRAARREAGHPTHPATAGHQQIIQWMEYLEYDRVMVDRRDGKIYRSPLSPSSRKAALAALKSFYRWMMYVDPNRKYDPTVAVERPVVEVVKQDALTREELEVLLNYRRPKPARSRPGSGLRTVDDARERVIVWMLAYLGLRCEELVRLTWASIDFDNRVVFIMGKGRKSRVVDILPELEKELLEWRVVQRRFAAKNQAIAKAQEQLDTDFVLLTKNGRPLAKTTVWRCVKRRAARAGIWLIDEPGMTKHGRTADNQSRVSPHSIRRGFATALLEAGVHLDAVSDLLGHSDTSTTRKHYTNPRDDRRRAAMEHLRIA